MTVPSLLPPNATPLERDLEQASARVGAVATPILDLWDPYACPAALLPYLAWGLSIDRWETTWTEAEKRYQIAQAITLQRRKGTPMSVDAVLASLDHLLEVVEWFEQTPPGAPFTFEVRYPLTDAPASARTAGWAEKIVREVSIVKPVRAHFRLVQQFVLSGSIAAYGAARALLGTAVFITAALDVSQPWADLLQTETGEPVSDDAGEYLDGTA